MKSYRNAIESLEKRQLMAASPLKIVGTDVRILADSDGTIANANTVTVTFSGNISSSVDASDIRMFGYANNTIDGGQLKKTIGIASATASGNVLTLRTSVLVRKGAQLTLNVGAVKDTNGDDVTGTVKTRKGSNRNRFTLALRAFRPADPTKFDAARFSGGVNSTTANTPQSDSTVRADLNAFLQRKVDQKTITTAQKNTAMGKYDNSTNKALVPAHNLRAAIVSLVGTIAEPAIGFYLEKKNATGKDLIKFTFDGDDITSGAKISELSYTSSGRLKIVWNPNYAGESFVVLSGLVAHEIIHEGADYTNSQDEEVIANFVENTVYAQQVIADFNYTNKGTVLTTRANYRLLALINSGDNQFPRVGVRQAPLTNTTGALPGFTPFVDSTPGTPIKSFDDDIREEFIARDVADKNPLPSQATARQILSTITGNTYTSSMTYGDNLIRDIDIGQDTLGDAYVMGVARVLQVYV